MKTSDVLRKAGDVSRERGWCQNTVNGPGGALCLYGAIWHGANCENDGSYDRARDVVTDEVLNAMGSIWNDHFRRTHDEVLIALDAAYVLALQEEGEDDLTDYEEL